MDTSDMKLPVELQQGEEVVKFLRRHPIYVILKLVGIVIALILLLLFVSWLTDILPGLLGGIEIWLQIILIVGAAVFGLALWYGYRNDFWAITNRRLIDYSQPTPFRKQTATASLGNIQDASIQVKGILASLFKFGDVICQTAGNTQNFMFRGVPNPNEVLATIDDLRNKAQ